MTKNHTGAEHHSLAANRHEQAARHHRQASKHYEEKDYAHAAHQSLIAHAGARQVGVVALHNAAETPEGREPLLGRTQQAIFHGREAGKYHAEHYGRAAPSAEVL
jgi:hypothetical protein